MQLHNIPLYGAGVLMVGMITTYTVSVALGHVYYWFPFISDTGAEPPESGIFGFMLNVTAALFIISIYIRYCQLRCLQTTMLLNMSPVWNKLSLVFGFLACFGMNVVANFSEIDMGTPHMTGALMCFLTATLYFLIQTKISYHFVNHKSDFAISKVLFMIRFGLSMIMTPFFFLAFWYGNLAILEFTGKKLNYWLPEDGGFEYRLIATFSEWITAMSICVYIGTFTHEFKRLKCEVAVRIKE